MRRCPAAVLLLVLSALSVPGGATTLRVGVYENPPKVYSDARGRPTGLFVELLDAVARREGWQLDYRRCHWDDCLRQLEAGELDLMPDVAYSAARAQHFDFNAVPVTYSWSQLFARQGSDIRRMGELRGHRIAVLKGSIQRQELGNVLAGHGVAWTPVEADTYDDVFDAVRDGKADVAVANRFFGSRAARSYGLAEMPVVFNPSTLFFAARQGTRAQELARIDHWLRRWHADRDSVYFRATARALAPMPVTSVPRWLNAALAAAAGLIVLLAAFALVLRWRVRAATADADDARTQLEHVLDASPVVLFQAHADGERLVIDWVSSNVPRLYGFTIAEVRGPDWWATRVHPDDPEAHGSEVDQLRRDGTFMREYRLVDGRGATRHVREEAHAMEAATGDTLRAVITWSDVSEAKAHAAELTFLAHHDALTDLPNRVLLHLFLDDAARGDAPLAVVVVDLDRLRGVNDALGHAVGDQALRAAAQRLRRLAPAGGFIGRLGGDEFALVLPGVADRDAVEAFACRLIDAFAQPLLAAGDPVVLTATLGVAFHPRDGANADSLLRNAELALYEAKRQGAPRWHAFERALSIDAEQRLAVENGLRVAMAGRQFRLHYQPQLDLRDGRLVGVEALVRWEHPQWGLVAPGRFIPVAEETGLIHELGLWVLMEACQQLRAWDDAGLAVPSLSVNCSVRELDVAWLPAQIAAVLASTGLGADRLELEITESMLMQDPERAIAVLNALRQQGVRIAVDDFGTGHSSLAYLKRLPLTRLKIDRAFVSGIGDDPGDEEICRTVIALASNLRLETLAEGVEHAHQAAFLRAGGCELAQGFHFAYPMPAPDLEAWVHARSAPASD